MIFNKVNKSRSWLASEIYTELRINDYFDGKYHSEEEIESTIACVLCDYHIYKPQNVKGKNIWFRLLSPFWLIATIFTLLIILPIKWVITGKFKLDINEKGFSQFMRDWTNKTIGDY